MEWTSKNLPAVLIAAALLSVAYMAGYIRPYGTVWMNMLSIEDYFAAGRAVVFSLLLGGAIGVFWVVTDPRMPTAEKVKNGKSKNKEIKYTPIIYSIIWAISIVVVFHAHRFKPELAPIPAVLSALQMLCIYYLCNHFPEARRSEAVFTAQLICAISTAYTFGLTAVAFDVRLSDQRAIVSMNNNQVLCKRLIFPASRALLLAEENSMVVTAISWDQIASFKQQNGCSKNPSKMDVSSSAKRPEQKVVSQASPTQPAQQNVPPVQVKPGA